MPKTVTLKLTKPELWLLMNNFGASYETGHDTDDCEKLSDKLGKAFGKFKDQ
jgi:hypothetical protein